MNDRSRDSKLFLNGQEIAPEKWNAAGINATDPSGLMGFCYSCGAEVKGEEALPSPDPFAEEIRHNDTPVVECDNCRYESCQDI